MRILVNFLAFQLGWFACVLGGAWHRPWLGVAVVTIVAAIHLWGAARPGSEALLLLIVAVIGTVWDGLLAGLGLLVYPSGMIAPWLPPVWIIAMWVAFATTLNVALRWMQGHWYLASACGALGGPLAYYAGSQLGGVTFPEPALALAVLGAGWAILTPLLVWLAMRYDGFTPATCPSATPPTITEARQDV